MLLSISTNSPRASDLGFLLHKHPDRFQTFELSFGKCHAFYPESGGSKTTFCLMLDVDPVEMARGKKRKSSFALAGYVNDRPYVASSFLSVAITQVLGSALNAKCNSQPDLVNEKFDFNISIDVLPVQGGEGFLRKVFEPLGYNVNAEQLELDSEFPDWGNSRYFSVTLVNSLTLSEMLSHLYVLIPVFDNQKHYFVSTDELEKLLAKGTGWLENHPEAETIARRYLKFQPSLFHKALEILVSPEEPSSNDSTESTNTEVSLEQSISLHDQRLFAVIEQLIATGAAKVIDLGCGEGKLLQRMMKEWQFTEIVGMDVSIRSLEIAHRRLRLDELPSFQAGRVKLIHGSLMYRDKRFADFDAAAIVEVIEHLDPPRLAAFEKVVFGNARPKTIIITTPNAEYNVNWLTLPAGNFRHSDHRFEWTRDQFAAWSTKICQTYKYTVDFFPVGPVDEKVGPPTQMGVFRMSGLSDRESEAE